MKGDTIPKLLCYLNEISSFKQFTIHIVGTKLFTDMVNGESYALFLTEANWQLG